MVSRLSCLPHLVGTNTCGVLDLFQRVQNSEERERFWLIFSTYVNCHSISLVVPDLLVLLRFLANFGEESLPYQVVRLVQDKAVAHLKDWFHMSTTCPSKLNTFLLFPSTRKK